MQSEVSENIFILAHELKSPWTLARQLSLSLDPSDQKSVKCTKENLIKVSDRALRQVEDLTRIARLEDGLFTMEPIAIRNLCDEITAELANLYPSDQKSLNIKYSNKAKLIVANPTLLKSIIYNFTTNALHYSETGTTTLLTLRDHQKSVRLTVRDFGPALPTKIWRELTNKAYNHPTNIAMRPGSSGLGLYIASKFSKYMHLDIGAIRHRDGTSFFLDLPISTQTTLF